MTIHDEINAIAQAAFEADLPPLHYAIYDLMNAPINCRLCGCNRWQIERVLADDTPIFTCSHGTVEGVIRQVDSVNGREVWYTEEIE